MLEQVVWLTEIVAAACLLVVLVFLAVTFWRRRLMTRSGDVSACGLRHDPTQRWRLGLLRLASESLDWFPLVGFTARPRYRWVRLTLELGVGPQRTEDEEDHPVLGRVVRVPFTAVEQHGGPVTAELAINVDRYTAIRAWVEAAPPGARPLTG